MSAVAAAMWTAASEWSPGAKGRYSADLRARTGLTIGEASDALEWLGWPRLSECSPKLRAAALEALSTPRGLAAAWYVQGSRAAILAYLKAHRALDRQVRAERGLGVPSSLRLSELLELYSAVLVLEVEADETAKEAA